MLAASSSGISQSNSSSMAMINSTVSRESAPRSSTKVAAGTTLSASTPNWETMMSLTLSSTSAKRAMEGRATKGVAAGAKAEAPARRVAATIFLNIILETGLNGSVDEFCGSKSGLKCEA